ncbi:F169A protein, partial [Urocolius indicus]|nr:F169A protein [Urocolius indicus]
QVPINLSTVGFVPIYGEDLTHKVLALFAPWDSLTAVALYLADQWWSIDDILKTSDPPRQGLLQVKSVGERIILYALNRIIYRTQEMEENEIPFLCHGSNEYAKIMWKDGEAIGFYSVKPKGSVCSSYHGGHYRLPVLNTIFVRKKHRGKDSGLIILEDFVESFAEGPLGLRYPLSPFMYTGKLSTCKQYLEKYPEDHNLLWEVQGAGYWFQRKSVTYILQKEKLKIAAEASRKENESSQVKDHVQQSATVSEASEQNTELETQSNVSTDSYPYVKVLRALQHPNIAPASIWTRNSHLRRSKLGRCWQESEPQTPQGREENALRVSKSRISLNTCCRLELSAHTCENSEDLEVSEKDTPVLYEEIRTEDSNETLLEMEVHVSPSEKRTPSEPLNGEVREETAKTSLTTEEETANKALSDEPKLRSESQGEEPVTLIVPLILESPAKSSEDIALEKVLNVSDSEVLTEESTSVEKQGTEGQQGSEKTTTENAAASAQKEEHSDNGLPNSTVTEAAEEPVSENVSPKPASSSEDQNEDTEHNSHETPVPLSQSSLIVVELEGVSFQVPPGQEGQKNQVEEQPKEPEQTQTSTEWAADSSSEEAEVEVPIVDRRNLRRKAKGYKGPPKKKGKPA